MQTMSEKDRKKLKNFLNSPKWIEMIQAQQKHSEEISEYIRKMSVVSPEILNRPFTK